eukprot:TRINITY_DN29169_c0_g1_i1.p1 TRINITY_DN29169_c0_g1~~TRINITY_DN29169_c0_g1_i1.p1  ORF type:complete len:186 (-),score=29.99 TRINITY_DN29169_c0_g1_i1:386-889(-)
MQRTPMNTACQRTGHRSGFYKPGRIDTSTAPDRQADASGFAQQLQLEATKPQLPKQAAKKSPASRRSRKHMSPLDTEAVVKKLLQEAALALLQVPDRSLPVRKLYLSLSDELVVWLYAQSLRITDILEWYKSDFNMYEPDGISSVTYLHPSPKEVYIPSSTSPLISL